MKSIILDRKTGVSQETSANNFDIGSSKIVILNITKNNILSITQNDNQLVVQLKSGNPIIINDFYGSQNGNNENELVIDDPSEEELGYWWIEEPNTGLNWVHLDDLNPLMITNTSDGISPWIYAAGAGILAAGALAGGGGGGGGGHHHKGQQIATPVVSSNNAEGITGTGTPGWEIVLTKPDNTTEVTTVDEDGKWSFNQNGNPLAHGETGKIIARDPQNNDKVSKEVETVADHQPPEPPVVEINNSNGISGTAEPNSTITITNSDGEVVCEAITDANGNWHTEPNPLADGEEGHFTATDKAGNTSGVTNHIADTVAPVAPIVEQNNASGISGTAEPNSTITITNSDGEVVGEAITDANGNWHTEPNPLADGEEGHFTATDKAGNTSGVTNHIADTVAPVAPIVEQNNASGISGTAEPNSKVTVTNSQGQVIGSVITDAEGKWHIEPNPLANGEEGHFTATDKAGNISEVTDDIADVVAPDAPIVEQNNANGISGTTEPNSRVTITNSKGEVVAIVVVDAEGKWHIDYNPLADGETGHFTATDKAGNTSEVTNHTADTVAPDAPIVHRNNASGISGTAEPNSKVTVTNSQGQVIGSVITDAEGKWHIEPNPLANNQEGYFTATDNAGNISQVTNHIADTVAPVAPIVEQNNASGISGTGEPHSIVTITNEDGNVLNIVEVDAEGNWHLEPNPLSDGGKGHFIATDKAGNESLLTVDIADTVVLAPEVNLNNANQISGTAEPNSKVTITKDDGTVLAVVDVDANGNWHIEPNPLAHGEKGHFTVIDKAGNISAVTDSIADTVAPNAPIVEKNNASGISGTAEPHSTVTIAKADGTVLEKVEVDAEGKWHIDSNPLANDEAGRFTATDKAGNTSEVTTHTADTKAPDGPVVEKNNGSGISGTAEPHSTVTIAKADGTVLEEVKVDADGNWHIEPNPLANEEAGRFTATDKAGNTSEVTNHTADTKAPDGPVVEKNNGSGISGTAEPHSTVTIAKADGTVLEKVKVDAEGNWHIEPNPLANEEAGRFTATDKAGNTSEVTTHTADTKAPDGPVVEKNNGSGISGTAEPHSTVTIAKADGTVLEEVKVDADGNWHIEPNPLANEEAGRFTATDKAGNTSEVTTHTADTKAPDGPVVEKNNGSGISGTAEPNSTVTIAKADGTVLEKVEVDAEGKWHIDSNPLANDEAGRFTATDKAGNTSEVTTHTADTKAPDGPVVEKNNGSGISGTAEPHSTVTIAKADGTVLEKVEVDAEGKWHIDSNPLANDEAGRFTATDKAGNTSEVTTHTADTVAPKAPEVKQNNASGISGTAEPHSTVTIAKADGTVLEEVKVDADGNWHIEPNPLANEEAG
ncbi:hypothetical protein DKK76_04545, partial [Frischella perrara]